MATSEMVEVTQATGLPVASTWFCCPSAGKQSPVLLYVYGGTFAINPGPSHEKIAAVLAQEIKGSVLLPSYSLAPEHPFPLGIEDVVATYRALIAEGFASDKIVMMGDTAGAAIAFGALLSLRDQGDALPAGAVALFPWVDLTMSGGSYVDLIRHDGHVSDLELLATFLSDYLQGADPRDPLASPALADLRGLPPLHIHANVNDILSDDSRLLAERARQAGVAAQLYFWDDVPATLQRDTPFTQQMGTLFSTIGKFVRAHVGRGAKQLPRNRDVLQEEYLEIVANNIQPHMQTRIDEMFAWAKDHGPDWVWTFIEKRIEHGALATQEHIEREWLGSLFSDSVQPTMLLTASRYVVHANKAAHVFLENGSCFRRSGGRLVATSIEVERILRRVLQHPFLAPSKGDASQPASFGRIEMSDGETLFLHCRRLAAYGQKAVAPPVIVLKLMEENADGVAIDADCLVAWYNLSPREAALAVAFSCGTSLADYAAQESVSMATVRTQFAHIKSKLNAPDQAAVVRKILNAAALNH